MKDDDQNKPERIAKVIARAGICSRRDAERLIEEGRVKLNGRVLDTPATTVTEQDRIEVNGKLIGGAEPTRLWRYHKPRGLVTTHNDEQGRPTVFENLPPNLPRVISVGRLDLNSEGLLLLTNDGGLSRHLELPSTGLPRQYRVRAFGDLSDRAIEKLAEGVTVDGVRYGPIKTEIERQPGKNLWLQMTLHEGKNREIRRVLDYVGLEVNRLIRISYGPLQLGTLPEEGVQEVSKADIAKLLKQK